MPSAVDLLLFMISIMLQVMWLGRYSSDALAAEGFLAHFVVFAFMFFLIFLMGGTMVISRRLGENKTREANVVFTQSLVFTAGFTLVILTAAIFTFKFIASKIFGIPPDIVQEAWLMLKAVAPFGVFMATGFMGMGLIRGSGDTFISMQLSLFINIINLVLSFLLIYGKLGLPELGIQGMGISLGISHTLGFFLLLFFVLTRKTRLSFFLKAIYKPSIPVMKSVVKAGAPVALEQIVWGFAIMVMQAYAARLPEVEFKFHQLIVQVLELVNVIYQGIGIANMTLLGQAIGAGDTEAEWRIHKHTRRTVLPISVVVGLLMFLFSDVIVHTFLPDLADISIGSRVLKVFAIFQIPRSLVILTSSHIRARGDVMWMVLSTGTLAVIFEIGLAYFLGIHMGYGLMGLWVVVGMDETTKYIVHRIRLAQQKFHRV